MKQYSLSELCRAISMSLEMTLPDSYWVRCEISELHVRQHAYFELIEKEERTSSIAAKMRATCWANVYGMLSAYFLQETGQSLRVGMQVLVEVKVVFHQLYGLSLNIINIDPSYTIGDLAKQKQQTIARLEKDGVIDMQKSLTLPKIIKRVAIISSASAAGYEDFLHQLQNNDYRLAYSCTLFDATMQGETAAMSCRTALGRIMESGTDYDVVVIIRGGGATTDLSCFDDYELSAECAQYPIPILSGIGHTRDISIVDMVSFATLKTPTAVAEYLIEHNYQQLVIVERMHSRLRTAIVQKTSKKRQQLMRAVMSLRLAFNNCLQKDNTRLINYQNALRLHSPEKILSKGYSLTSCNGKLIRSKADVREGDVLVTELIDGIVESVVR